MNKYFFTLFILLLLRRYDFMQTNLNIFHLSNIFSCNRQCVFLSDNPNMSDKNLALRDIKPTPKSRSSIRFSNNKYLLF